jgi:hypothetical protein
VRALFVGRLRFDRARRGGHAHPGEIDEIAADHQTPRQAARATRLVPAQEGDERLVALLARSAALRLLGAHVLHEIAPEVQIGEREQVVLAKSRHSSVWTEARARATVRRNSTLDSTARDMESN